MGGPQSRSGHFEEEINLLSLLGIERLGQRVNHARNQKKQGPGRYNPDDCKILFIDNARTKIQRRQMFRFDTAVIEVLSVVAG
jgi:hypothetical protein